MSEDIIFQGLLELKSQCSLFYFYFRTCQVFLLYYIWYSSIETTFFQKLPVLEFKLISIVLANLELKYLFYHFFSPYKAQIIETGCRKSTGLLNDQVLVPTLPVSSFVFPSKSLYSPSRQGLSLNKLFADFAKFPESNDRSLLYSSSSSYCPKIVSINDAWRWTHSRWPLEKSKYLNF